MLKRPLQLLACQRVVTLDRISSVDFGPVVFRDSGFHIQNAFGSVGWLRVICLFEKLFAVGKELGTRLNKFRVVTEVVVTVRHAEASLRDVARVLG